MEQANRWANGLNAWTLRGNTEILIDNAPDTAAAPRHNEEPAVIDVAMAEPKPDWSGTLALVQEAGAALRSSEERIEELEAEAEQAQLDSRTELEALQAQLRLARREIERAYDEAAAATARAAAAEAWLDKLGGTIVSSFGRLNNGSQRQPS